RDRLPARALQPLLPEGHRADGHRLDVCGRAAARRPGHESERDRTRVPHHARRESDQRLRRQDDHVPLAGPEGGHARRRLRRASAEGARAALRPCTRIAATMTYVPPFDATAKPRPRLPRDLDPVEVRILGALMEKQLSTPEYYPLTLNALVAAANQKSNREPVMEL